MAEQQSQNLNRQLVLTKHENVTFEHETVFISGQAFVNCRFVGCTLVLRDGIFHLEKCAFERCNWHVDMLLLWANAQSLQALKSLIGMLEQDQSRLNAALDQQQSGKPAAS